MCGMFTAALLTIPLTGITVGCSSPTPHGGTSANLDKGPPRGESPADRDHVDADGIVRRGNALSGTQSMTVGAIMERASSLDGQTVKVTGEVGRVCSKSGCWFELKGDPAHAGIRITSKGYRFFVPSSAKGMRATLEGQLKVRLLDVATAQHYADDEAEGTGKPAARVTAPVAEVSIAAVGLEMRDPAAAKNAAKDG